MELHYNNDSSEEENEFDGRGRQIWKPKRVSGRRLEGAESIFSDVVALHSVDGNTYNIKFEVQLNFDVSLIRRRHGLSFEYVFLLFRRPKKWTIMAISEKHVLTNFTL